MKILTDIAECGGCSNLGEVKSAMKAQPKAFNLPPLYNKNIG